MVTINVRVDDQVRDALKDLADAEGVTLSEYIRDLLREAVFPLAHSTDSQFRHGDEPAPETLSFMERKTLSMLHRILGHVLPEDANGVDGDNEYQMRCASMLEEGFTGEYGKEVAGFATELSKRDSRRVTDILQMFRVINSSISEIGKSETPIASDLVEQLAYQGFDYNDALEGQMASYVQHLLASGRWSELKPAVAASDDGNSHMKMLEVYMRMLAEYRRIMASREGYSREEYLLSAKELVAISGAQIHPSRRG